MLSGYEKNDFHQRKSVRLKDYDYSSENIYFFTICTKDKITGRHDFILSKLAKNDLTEEIETRLTDIGRVCDECIKNIPKVYDNTTLEAYVIMPNHIHLIIGINKAKADDKTPDACRIITSTKSVISKKLGYSIWQKNSYDTVLKTYEQYEKQIMYIANNPAKWYYMNKEMLW